MFKDINRIENLNGKYLVYSSKVDLSDSTPEHKCLYFEKIKEPILHLIISKKIFLFILKFRVFNPI